MFDQFTLGYGAALLRHDKGLDRFSIMTIRAADDHRVLHRRMLEQDLFDFPRIDRLPPGLDHVLLAVHEKEEALLVSPDDISGIEPPFPQHRSGVLIFLPVPLHDLRPADDQLSRFPRREIAKTRL